jgi:hypothetical protein
MPKNLSALAFLEQENPDLAAAYKAKVKESKRRRAREFQRKMAKAYSKMAKAYKEKDQE